MHDGNAFQNDAKTSKHSPPVGVVGTAVTGQCGDEASGAGAVGAVFVGLLLRYWLGKGFDPTLQFFDTS
jgi:hypothetical protein